MINLEPAKTPASCGGDSNCPRTARWRGARHRLDHGHARLRERGLIEGRVGQGTFVSESSLRPQALTPEIIDVDLSMNVPPQPAEAALDSRIAQSLAAIERRAGFSALMNYHRPGGGPAELEQAVRWLAPRLRGLSIDGLAVFPASQSAIFSVLLFLCRPGPAYSARTGGRGHSAKRPKAGKAQSPEPDQHHGPGRRLGNENRYGGDVTA